MTGALAAAPALVSVLLLAMVVAAQALSPLRFQPASGAPGLHSGPATGFGVPRAPGLPPPTGPVVRVDTVEQLEDAVTRLRPGTTILVSPGDYRLHRDLVVRGVDRVAIRGATGRPGDVVIRGTGMASPGVNVVLHVQQARDVLVADLSLGEAAYHLLQLHGETGTDRVRVYNVRFFDAGQQFIKASVDFSRGDGVDDTDVEYCVFEYTRTGPPSGYTAAIDILRGANWRIRLNLFRNITAPRGVPPAVLAWHGSRGVITDRNTFIDCARAVVYGLQPQPAYGHSHEGGVISNNIVAYTRAWGSDAGIAAWDSPNTRIVHNTVWLNGTFPNAIEYRFPGSAGVEIVNNLTDGRIAARDGASARLAGNVAARADMFVSATAGDLHLTAAATAALGRGASLPNPSEDWDGDPRPADTPDVGADQLAGAAR